MATTAIAAIDIVLPPVDAGPAVAVPGCRLIPQCGHASWFGSTVFEQEGQVFMARRFPDDSFDVVARQYRRRPA
jgi:hypothetical protein